MTFEINPLQASIYMNTLIYKYLGQTQIFFIHILFFITHPQIEV